MYLVHYFVQHQTNRQIKGPSSHFLFWCCHVYFETSLISVYCLSSLSCFSLHFPHSTRPHAFKGGWEPVNSSSRLPCHQWPAHPSSHRPPSHSARTEVGLCVYVCALYVLYWSQSWKFLTTCVRVLVRMCVGIFNGLCSDLPVSLDSSIYLTMLSFTC